MAVDEIKRGQDQLVHVETRHVKQPSLTHGTVSLSYMAYSRLLN